MLRAPSATVGFLSIDDLANNQGELAITIENNSEHDTLYIEACVQLPENATCNDIVAAYISLCSNDSPTFDSFFTQAQSNTLLRSAVHNSGPHMYTLEACPPLAIFVGKKYKPVACKIRPIETELPSCFQIICKVQGDPLQDIPKLNLQPLDFTATGQYMEECKAQFDQVHNSPFLLLEERKLIHHFMCLQNRGFAWSDQERRLFCKDFFPPVEIPTIPHKLWAQHNILIPPGIYDEVCCLIKVKIDAGIYEPSMSHSGLIFSFLSPHLSFRHLPTSPIPYQLPLRHKLLPFCLVSMYITHY